MHCKRLITLLSALLIALVSLAGPKQKSALSHIKFGKCRVVSLVPTGLRSVRASLELEAKNDTSAFQLQDVKLTIFRKGEPFADGSCDGFSVPKGTSKVNLTGEFELCDNMSLWSAVTALRNPDLSEFTGDVDLTVVVDKGRKVAWSQKGISIGDLAGKSTDKKDDKKTDSRVSTADTPASTSAKQAGEPVPQKPNQPKQTTKKKRPWWQFWKK